jgi:hypothetical protein
MAQHPHGWRKTCHSTATLLNASAHAIVGTLCQRYLHLRYWVGLLQAAGLLWVAAQSGQLDDIGAYQMQVRVVLQRRQERRTARRVEGHNPVVHIKGQILNSTLQNSPIRATTNSSSS